MTCPIRLWSRGTLVVASSIRAPDYYNHMLLHYGEKEVGECMPFLLSAASAVLVGVETVKVQANWRQDILSQ